MSLIGRLFIRYEWRYKYPPTCLGGGGGERKNNLGCWCYRCNQSANHRHDRKSFPTTLKIKPEIFFYNITKR